MKNKIIKLASQERSSNKELQPYIDYILKAIGFPESLITDESMISDFLTCFAKKDIDKIREKELNRIRSKIKYVNVDKDSYIVDIATNLKKYDDANRIYTITGICAKFDDRLKKNMFHDRFNGKLIESQRSFGWYKEESDAIDAVKNNRCDIRELYYNYMVIEKLMEGIHCHVENEMWFKWDGKSKFKPCKKPLEINNICNFSIG